jgi:Flp pilus assembly protein CpaB
MDLRAGDRTWELRQGGNVVLDSRIQPGDRVDVMAAVAKSGQESVQHIISGARVLAVQGKDKDFTIVLAVSLDQGKSLMEAENFAKQVRAVRDPLVWAPGGGKP